MERRCGQIRNPNIEIDSTELVAGRDNDRYQATKVPEILERFEFSIWDLFRIGPRGAASLEIPVSDSMGIG
jgi:hypothetical protein